MVWYFTSCAQSYSRVWPGHGFGSKSQRNIRIQRPQIGDQNSRREKCQEACEQDKTAVGDNLGEMMKKCGMSDKYDVSPNWE
jgi:hypothetical protein